MTGQVYVGIELRYWETMLWADASRGSVGHGSPRASHCFERTLGWLRAEDGAFEFVRSWSVCADKIYRGYI